MRDLGPPVDSVVLVGAGPRATGVLQALAGELDGSRRLTVHVVDPYPCGAGRIWRADQPGQLWMNNTADEITVHPDGTGPTLADWSGSPGAFLPRREVASYLRDAFARAVDALPECVTVCTWRTRAVQVSVPGPGAGRQVTLQDGTVLRADVVVLAQGHLDVRSGAVPGQGHTPQGHTPQGYTPPGYTADQDLTGVPAGADVLVRGFGLAFIDLMMLLSEGRSGRFDRRDGGPVPTYRPSGEEPVLWVGSRRGVPYRSKIAGGVTPRSPRYLTTDAVARLPRTPDGALADGAVRTLLSAEVTAAHYTALADLGDRGRCAVDAGGVHELTDAWAAGTAGVTARTVSASLGHAVPDPADRLRPDRLDRPLAGRVFADREALEDAVVGNTLTNLHRATGGRHPQDAALYATLVGVLPVLRGLLRAADGARLSAQDEAFVRQVCASFSYVCSGPPPERLGNLLALHRAGLVRFLGADARVVELPGHRGGGFRATSPSLPGEAVEATRLVDARLADVTASQVSDGLLRGLLASGEVATGHGDTGEAGAEVFLVDAEGRAVGRDGQVRDDLFLVGPATSSPVREGFARPGTDARVFAANRSVARSVARSLEGTRLLNNVI